MSQRCNRDFRRNIALLVHSLLLCACLAQPAVTPLPTATIPTMVLQPSATAKIPRMAYQPPAIVILPTWTVPPQPARTPEADSILEGASLVEALRQGGYVIYFRHAATDEPNSQTDIHIIRDCAGQGNLNEQGWEEARAIGESFLSLKIPVGTVSNSEYCRARDTALLAFGQADATENLTAFPYELRGQRMAALRQMLSTLPAPGANTILISHGPNIEAVAGVTLAEGEAAIFLPLGEDGFRLVARVLPDQWVQLERLVVSSLQVGPVSDPSLLLPDLQPLPPTDVKLRVHSITGEKLLRFTNSILNHGPGPMELWGYSNPNVEKTIVVQHIYSTSDSSRNVPVGEFIFHPAHDHWHMENFSRYDLWTLNSNGGLDKVVVLADKVSYCLRDDARSELPDAPRSQTYQGCYLTRQGITPGWIDIYQSYLEGQSMEITSLPNGIYALRSTVNPTHQLWEADYSNNATVLYVEINENDLDVIDIANVIQKLTGSK